MNARISLKDLEIAWQTVDEAAREGRGALHRTAERFGVPRPVVMHALNRVEKAMGGQAFFRKAMRRSGELTEFGERFWRDGRPVLEAWQAICNSK